MRGKNSPGSHSYWHYVDPGKIFDKLDELSNNLYFSAASLAALALAITLSASMAGSSS